MDEIIHYQKPAAGYSSAEKTVFYRLFSISPLEAVFGTGIYPPFGKYLFAKPVNTAIRLN